MCFNVVNLETGELACPAHGLGPYVYELGKDASEAAKALTEATGIKHQPRRVVSVDWRERERKRFSDGIYQHVPWQANDWVNKPSTADHFVHVSTEEPGKLAFTESAEKGAADRQTRMKPGRYLTQFYSDDLSPGSIRHFSVLFANMYMPEVVKFATSPDDIERVYTNGPRSCMSSQADAYESSEHPVRVYGAGDLAVAYLAPDDEGDDHITARCVCWPDKKLYTQIYGDACRLEPALEKLGFREGSMRGARLLRICDGHGFIVPYVDGISYAEDTGRYLVLMGHRGGDIDCQTTNGVSGPRAVCDNCGEAYDPDSEGVYIEDREETWCDHCGETQAFFCDYMQRTCAGESVSMANGETWSQCAFNEDGVECEATGACIPSEDCVVLADGTIWSQAHFDSNGYHCSNCGDSYANDDKCSACAEAGFTDTPLHAGCDESPNQIELFEVA